MTEATYEEFGSSRPPGQNSLDPMWIRRRNGVQGTLEGNPHNSVHGIVGGVMGGFSSANDPIFMMHHCNVDRIWWVWNSAGNVNSSEALWRDMPFQNNFFNPNGTPYSPKVSDLFSPEALGYTYDVGLGTAPVVAAAPPAAAPPGPTPLASKLTTLFADLPDLSASKAAGIATFVAANKDQAVAAPNKPLEIPVDVQPNQVAGVARYIRPAAGTELFGFGLARQRVAAAPRALCFIRDIEATNDESTQYRVFIDCDYLSATTPIADRHYAGTFSFFGRHDGHGNGGHPSVVVDLTRPIQRIYGSTTEAPSTLRVQILPVPKGKGGDVGTAKPSRVEVAIVTS